MSVAGDASAHEVDAMFAHLEPDCVGRRSSGFGQSSLESGRRSHVLNGSARSADQVMVVVAGEVLGKFEATVLICALHPADDARIGQHRQVPVRRALRYPRCGLHDLGDGQRPLGCRQHLDQLLSLRRVALLGRAEPQCRLSMEVVAAVAGCGWRRAQCSSQWLSWAA